MRGSKKTDAQILYKRVINKNYCIGCGLCAAGNDPGFKMIWNSYGLLEPIPVKDLSSCKEKVLSFCPFSDNASNEDQLSDIFFNNINTKNPDIGKYLDCFAGYVIEPPFRNIGTSGGFSKWFAYYLLKRGYTTHHVHVVQVKNSNKGELFKYQIYSNCEDILSQRAKSAYYPVTLDEVINYILKNDGRYSITALPCFSKAIRLYSLNNRTFGQRIYFVLGIICGSLKSANYSKSISWQMGIAPDEIEEIDFRVKIENKDADCQGNMVRSSVTHKSILKTNQELFGLNYGMGFFRPHACDFCDDIVAETADISFGDAWLVKYKSNSKGTSVLIVRNHFLLNMLNEAAKINSIHLDILSPSEVIESQAGSFRHRREGLAYRLNYNKRRRKFVPTKRVNPIINKKISKERKKIYHHRYKISYLSHIAFLKAIKKRDLHIFYNLMQPHVNKYNSKNSYKSTFFKTKHAIKSYLKKMGVFSILVRILTGKHVGQ